MFTTQRNRIIKGMAVYLVFSLVLSACNLPIPGIATQAPTAFPGISDAMLTAAAATINAHFNAVNTPTPLATEIPPDASTPEFIPTAEAQSLATTEAPPAPTETSMSLATSTTSSAQQAVNPTATMQQALITVIPVTIAPVSPQVVEYGTQFKIQNINLHPCSGGFNAIFKISNQSSSKLESLSLHLQDLTTGAVLLGPWISNAPFMNTDRTCATGGIDLLYAGQTRYIGNSLGGSYLSGHTIRATLMLCAKESLNGICSQKMVDFVVP